MSVVVTIGRNVNGEPMGDSDWEDFIDAVHHALYSVYNPPVYFAGKGKGESVEWGYEEAYCVIAEEVGFRDQWELLKSVLTAVRILYKQEAVAVQGAFSGGIVEFV